MTNVEPLQALNMDSSQQQAFVRFYRNLPEKTSATVRFFNHSEYYTVHAEDSQLASEVIFDTKLIKFMGLEPKLAYIVLSRSNFEKFVKELLLVRQYRVEVYVKASQGRNNAWNLEYKGSPGNLTQFEEILFDNNTDTVINSFVMGVKHIKNQMLAVSCVNTTESKIYLTEFSDNEFYTQLDALIAQIGPKECVIPHGETPELIRLNALLKRCNILVVKMKKTDFSLEAIEQDLNRLLYFPDGQQRNPMALPEAKMTEALSTLQAVIKYLNLTADSSNFNQFKLDTTDLKRYVRVDTAALNALNVFAKPGQIVRNKYESLFGVLDHCVTAQGRRLLEQWIKHPLRDINLINERLEVVEALVKDPEARSTLTTGCLTRVPDMLMLAKKLSNQKANLQDCYKVYQVVDSVPGMLSVLRGMENKFVRGIIVDALADALVDLEKYQAMIEQTLDMNLVDRGEFLVKPTFDDELKEIHAKKALIEEKMQKALRHAAADLGVDSGKTLKLECNDQHGYFYRLTLKDESLIRNNKNYKVLDAIKGGVRFTNDKLSSLNDSYRAYCDSYEKQQKNVVQEILAIACGYADSLRNLNQTTAKLDVLVSFANAATSAPSTFVKPKLRPEGTGILRLIKARHPCLERQDNSIYIPNDIDLQKDFKCTLNIITGPNMGGKSTYMRSVALCVLMAQVGSFVPCEEAEISLVDSVFARVGADDCELKGLSTFMMEMVETCGIVRCATNNSLVIIDELGRGTSTYDGCGIAWSIAEHLANETKCFAFFATHYHEITQLAESISNVQNLHASAVVTEKTITPLYQIVEGPCDKSYGIHCARMADFPEDVIEYATKHQKRLEFAEGMKYISEYEPALKRKVIGDGDKLISDTLNKLKKASENLSGEKLLSELDILKSQLSGENLFLKGLLEFC